jgi:hypothetical protein
MTSERRLAANRRNARASTGPKTAAGKACAARNARRHGLAVPIGADPVLGAQAEAFAREIVGDEASPQLRALARAIAEAQLDIVRVRSARREVMQSSLGSLGKEKLALAISECATQLERFDRYERRALSRRKFAIRTLESALRQARVGAGSAEGLTAEQRWAASNAGQDVGLRKIDNL